MTRTTNTTHVAATLRPAGGSHSTRTRPLLALTLALGCALTARGAHADEPLTLTRAVRTALACHPTVHEALATEDAARARLEEARAAALPRGGLALELNRSTGNTPPGTYFPTPGVLPISGAPRGRALDTGTWQSGVAGYLSWDALSLLRRAAAVDRALAGVAEADHGTAARRLELATAAADAWLLAREAQASVRAAEAGRTRLQALAEALQPLVDQALKPQADLARLQAETAAATMALSRARALLEGRLAQLATLMGAAQPARELAPAPTLGAALAVDATSHPRRKQSEAAQAKASGEVALTRLEYLPRVDLAAALWARGSGLPVNGVTSPAEGALPDIANWGAGVTLAWPLLDLVPLRHRVAAAEATARAAEARHAGVALAVEGELREAEAAYRGAVELAAAAPLALQAARTAEGLARARFQAGLTPVVEVADAQRQLASAEAEDAIASLEVARATVLLARARGSLAGLWSLDEEEAPACGSSTSR